VAILVENHRIFPLPSIFAPFHEEGVPLEFGTSAWDQKCEWWGNRAEKKFDNNFHLRDGWTDRRTNGHGTTAKTVLTHGLSRLKPHQIVSMCCCTASIIHTYLLQCPVDSNSKL